MISLMSISQTSQDSRMLLTGFRKNSTITSGAYEVRILHVKSMEQVVKELNTFLTLSGLCTCNEINKEL
jgi:hypothetical protein